MTSQRKGWLSTEEQGERELPCPVPNSIQLPCPIPNNIKSVVTILPYICSCIILKARLCLRGASLKTSQLHASPEYASTTSTLDAHSINSWVPTHDRATSLGRSLTDVKPFKHTRLSAITRFADIKYLFSLILDLHGDHHRALGALWLAALHISRGGLGNVRAVSRGTRPQVEGRRQVPARRKLGPHAQNGVAMHGGHVAQPRAAIMQAQQKGLRVRVRSMDRCRRDEKPQEQQCLIRI